MIHTPFQIGKYLVSPLTRSLDDGRYAAIVSIRSGSGSMTHDRVMRFTPLFDTPGEATRFAADQATAWIGTPAPALAGAATASATPSLNPTLFQG